MTISITMKKSMKNYIHKILVAAFAVAIFAVGAAQANAQTSYVSWNKFTNDCPTVMVANHDTQLGAGSPCWPTYINAQPGETVNVRIYYHNTGNANAGNTIVQLSQPTGSRNTFTFTGFVSGGQAQASGQATIVLPSAQILTFSRVVVFPDQTTVPQFRSDGSNIFSGGISIGQINSGLPAGLPATCPQSNSFCHQGSVVVSFKVSEAVAPSSCAITSFNANPTSVAAGNSSTLSWNTNGCGWVSISNLGSQIPNGSKNTGALFSTTTYTLTAGGAIGGSVVTKDVTVTVNPVVSSCVIDTFYANPTSVASGNSSTLAWNTTGCTSVSISGIGSQSLDGSANTGALFSSRTYTLTAFGADGTSVTRDTTVSVNSAATCAITSFYASPSQVTYGSNSTLYWSTTNCTNVSVSGGAMGTSGTTYASSISTGAIYGPTVFTITANGTTGGSVTQSLTVTTTTLNSCAITSFYASPSQVAYGGTSYLSWTTNGCTYVNLSGGSISSSNTNPNSSASTNPIYGSTTFTLTAYGSNGQSTTQSVYVGTNGSGSCAVGGLYASPTQVAYGQSATLYWSAPYGTSVTVTGGNIGSSYQSGNSISTGPIYSTTTYTVTPYNCAGGYAQSQNITVYVSQQSLTNPTTTIATGVTQTSSRLNGILPASSAGTVNAYFEYGTSEALGLQTTSRQISTTTGINYFDTIPTQADTTYYYRAAYSYNGLVYRGGIIAFTTPSRTTYVPPVVNTVVYGTGGGSPLVSLIITDQFQSVNSGDTLNYLVTYKNISSQTLSNVMLHVVLPEGTTFRQTTQGMFTTNDTIVIPVGTLLKGQEGMVNIQAAVDQSISATQTLVATATLAFSTANNAQDNTIAYDMDTVNNRNNFAGFAFGSGFFPSTMLGWVLLIGIIIIIILIARSFNRRAPVATHADSHGDAGHH